MSSKEEVEVEDIARSQEKLLAEIAKNRALQQQAQDAGGVADTLKGRLTKELWQGREISATAMAVISAVGKEMKSEDDPVWLLVLPLAQQAGSIWDMDNLADNLRQVINGATKDIRLDGDEIKKLSQGVASRLEFKPPVLDEVVLAEGITGKLIGNNRLLNEMDRCVRKALLDLQPAVAAAPTQPVQPVAALVDYGKVEQIVDKAVGKAVEETVGRSLRDKNLLVSVSTGLAVVSLLGFLMFQSNAEKSDEIAKLQGQVQILKQQQQAVRQR